VLVEEVIHRTVEILIVQRNEWRKFCCVARLAWFSILLLVLRLRSSRGSEVFGLGIDHPESYKLSKLSENFCKLTFNLIIRPALYNSYVGALGCCRHTPSAAFELVRARPPARASLLCRCCKGLKAVTGPAPQHLKEGSCMNQRLYKTGPARRAPVAFPGKPQAPAPT
jgi:hypothetical protein